MKPSLKLFWFFYVVAAVILATVWAIQAIGQVSVSTKDTAGNLVRPTGLSSFANDVGYLTSTGSATYYRIAISPTNSPPAVRVGKIVIVNPAGVGLFSGNDNALATATFNTNVNIASIAGMKLWLKAGSLTNLSDGDSVTTWTDNSGTGNDATQGTASAKPTYKTNIVNANPVVRFDGGDFLTHAYPLGTSNDFSVFAVVKFSSLANYSELIGGTNGTWGPYAIHTSAAGEIYAGTANDAARIITAGSYVASSVWYVFSFVKSGAGAGNLIFAKNAANTQTNSGTAVAPSSGTMGVGRASTYYITGDVAEIAVYDRGLTSGDRDTVEQHLLSKYNLGSSGSNTWTFATPVAADTAVTEDVGEIWTYNGSNWVNVQRTNIIPFTTVVTNFPADRWVTNETRRASYEFNAVLNANATLTSGLQAHRAGVGYTNIGLMAYNPALLGLAGTVVPIHLDLNVSERLLITNIGTAAAVISNGVWNKF